MSMPNVPLAAKHTGFRVSAPGILLRKENNKGLRFMREEMHRHLEAVARQYYAGNIAIVDEFLQLYCLGEDEREALVNAQADNRPALAFTREEIDQFREVVT